MKKPEPYPPEDINFEENNYEAGYNNGKNDMEKWLPNEEEIEKICEKVVCKDYRYKKDIARAISKRLRGEK